ncbi:hypothetical protein H6783_01550 [Candidatus Nomurabacteria bacterium]|nr:hypothetical protein [Candidatus Nomurabacteria bacterium]
MKLAEKLKARTLRVKGHSIGEIATKLSVSKSSVSNWVADIELSSAQIKQLKTNSHSAVAVENRRRSRLKNENARREQIIEKAKSEVNKPTAQELFFLGVALYWGEGTKKKRGVVEFTNSDPKVVEVMMRFFRDVCSVPEKKFRGHVYIHEHLSIEKAEQYWSRVARIPRRQFYKTSIQHNRTRLKKDTLTKGTFAISICDTELKLRILGWIEGVYQTTTVQSCE